MELHSQGFCVCCLPPLLPLSDQWGDQMAVLWHNNGPVAETFLNPSLLSWRSEAAVPHAPEALGRPVLVLIKSTCIFSMDHVWGPTCLCAIWSVPIRGKVCCVHGAHGAWPLFHWSRREGMLCWRRQNRSVRSFPTPALHAVVVSWDGSWLRNPKGYWKNMESAGSRFLRCCIVYSPSTCLLISTNSHPNPWVCLTA